MSKKIENLLIYNTPLPCVREFPIITRLSKRSWWTNLFSFLFHKKKDMFFFLLLMRWAPRLGELKKKRPRGFVCGPRGFCVLAFKWAVFGVTTSRQHSTAGCLRFESPYYILTWALPSFPGLLLTKYFHPTHGPFSCIFHLDFSFYFPLIIYFLLSPCLSATATRISTAGLSQPPINQNSLLQQGDGDEQREEPHPLILPHPYKSRRRAV